MASRGERSYYETELSLCIGAISLLTNKDAVDVEFEIIPVGNSEQGIFLIARNNSCTPGIWNEIGVVSSLTRIMPAQEEHASAGNFEVVKLLSVSAEDESGVAA